MLNDAEWMEVPTHTFAKIRGYPPLPQVHGEPRHLRFPANRVMGNLFVHPWHDNAHLGATTHRSPWQFFAVAQGDVVIPAYHKAHLDISPTTVHNLAPLAELEAFDLQSLTLVPSSHLGIAANVPDTELRFLEHLTGIYDLKIAHLAVTTEGIQRLACLNRLQHLQLLQPGQRAWSHALYRSLTVTDLLPLGKLPELTVLDLSGIPLNDLPCMPCPTLRLLRLSYYGNDTPEAPDLDILPALAPELRALDLLLPSITDADMRALAALTLLEELRLSVSNNWDAPGVVSADGVQALAALCDLRRLGLTNIDLPTMAPLSHLPQLTTIRISRLRADGVLPELGTFPALRSVCMLPSSEEPLTYAEMSGLCAAQTLEHVSLSEDIAAEALRPLANLYTLRDLRLTGSSFSGQDIAYLANLTRLEVLDLSETNISDQDVAHLSSLTRLEVLDLSETNVSDQGVQQLAPLINLRSLSLSYTQMRGSSLTALQSLTRLQELRLFQIPLDDAGVQALAPFLELRQLFFTYAGTDATNLQVLRTFRHLTDLSLDGIPPGGLVPLHALVQLTWLGIGTSTLADKDMLALRHLPHLHTLFLDQVALSDAGWAILGTLPHVRILVARHTNIQDRHLAHLAGLSHLRKLDLEGTQISAAGLPALGKLTRLETLCLRDTHIGGMVVGADPLTALVPLQALINLDLMGTHVERERERDLQRLLPNLR
jgi:Leucine-rich repeat (LRR) protein